MRFLFPFFVVASLASAGLLETVTKRDDYWGGSVSLGPSKSTIINAVTTLIPGVAPPVQNGVLFLWPGVSLQYFQMVSRLLTATDVQRNR
jgi:hypothetical protein